MYGCVVRVGSFYVFLSDTIEIIIISDFCSPGSSMSLRSNSFQSFSSSQKDNLVLSFLLVFFFRSVKAGNQLMRRFDCSFRPHFKKIRKRRSRGDENTDVI